MRCGRRQPRFDRRRRDERGYVLATAAMVLVPLLLVSGFAVDIGAWYVDGARMQRAADAAALGGVVWLPDAAKARRVAVAIAAENGFDDASADVSVDARVVSGRRLDVAIHVDRERQYLSGFAVGHKELDRSAAAEFDPPVLIGSPFNYLGTGDIMGSVPLPPIRTLLVISPWAGTPPTASPRRC